MATFNDLRELAARSSVQDFPRDGTTPSLILQVAVTADDAPKWWTPRRDIYLDDFWPTEPFLAGAIYSVCSRNASFPFELSGPEDEVRWSQQLLAQADFGAGWQTFLTKVTLDL
ncbi:MAG: hypothetical protein GF350_12380, partial [Chitinivibrionales bacterium]|nr:hypothetical protein [Chitinivibrionales bacterium]